MWHFPPSHVVQRSAAPETEFDKRRKDCRYAQRVRLSWEMLPLKAFPGLSAFWFVRMHCCVYIAEVELCSFGDVPLNAI